MDAGRKTKRKRKGAERTRKKEERHINSEVEIKNGLLQIQKSYKQEVSQFNIQVDLLAQNQEILVSNLEQENLKQQEKVGRVGKANQN